MIFLINESTDTLKIKTESSDNYYIDFNKEVLDKSLEWKTEIPYGYCLVGSSSHIMKIPPNHYTWEKIDSSKYFGDYKTKMRVSFNLDSKNTLAKEFNVSYNSDLFLPKEEQHLKLLNKILSTGSNLSKKDSIRYLRMKSDAYIDMNKFKKSYTFCDSILNTDLKNDVIQFNKAKSLYRYISSNHKKMTELEKLAFVSKNLAIFKNIHSNHKGIDKQVKSYSKILNSILLSKKEFEQKFPERNKNYFFEIEFINIEKIRILYRQKN